MQRYVRIAEKISAPGAALQEFGLGAIKLGCALTFLGPVVVVLFFFVLASC